MTKISSIPPPPNLADGTKLLQVVEGAGPGGAEGGAQEERDQAVLSEQGMFLGLLVLEQTCRS